MTTPVHLDYCDWLTLDRLMAEELLWSEQQLYERYGAAIRRLLDEYESISWITELGSGTGWVPGTLDLIADSDRGGTLSYHMYDKNPHCIARSRERNAHRDWVRTLEGDIRTLDIPVVDLICSFAVLKHFRLEEWSDIVVRMLRDASFGLFTMPLADTNLEDGTEFTHTRVTREHLVATLARVGHTILWEDATDPAEPLFATIYDPSTHERAHEA